MLRSEFPDVVLLENESSMGSVASRDRLLRAATGDIVLSLDDDSYPLAQDFFSMLADIVAAHPEAAAISFPELLDGGIFTDDSKTSQSAGHYVPAYANCAAAMHRQFYLQQAGFPPFFTHMYEEPDYALQCYAAGRAVWFEPSLTIRHHRSPVGRLEMRLHHQNSRNELWSVWMRCPWTHLPIVSLFRIWRQFQYACACGPPWVLREPVWWGLALAGALKCLRARRPIAWPIYYSWMRLARSPGFTTSDLYASQIQSQSV